MNRRTFLKTSAGTAAVAASSPGLGAIASKSLPAVPSLASLASARMSHGFMELFNLPLARAGGRQQRYTTRKRSESYVSPEFLYCTATETNRPS